MVSNFLMFNHDACDRTRCWEIEIANVDFMGG